jgi:hypothetical protein
MRAFLGIFTAQDILPISEDANCGSQVIATLARQQLTLSYW